MVTRGNGITESPDYELYSLTQHDTLILDMAGEKQQQIDAECTKLAEEAEELAEQVEELTGEAVPG